jgi:hypothetical protein
MKITLNKSYNFNFLLWNFSIENFNKSVKIPNSYLRFFNYKDQTVNLFFNKWLVRITIN